VSKRALKNLVRTTMHQQASALLSHPDLSLISRKEICVVEKILRSAKALSLKK